MLLTLLTSTLTLSTLALAIPAGGSHPAALPVAAGGRAPPRVYTPPSTDADATVAAAASSAGHPGPVGATHNANHGANAVNPHVNLTARSQPGVYMCEKPNWGWPCWWQPAVDQCVGFSGSISLGPDSGVYCALFEKSNCDANYVDEVMIVKPGIPWGTKSGDKSFRCSTTPWYG